MSSPRRLTIDEANDIPSDWTADSKAVVFSSDRDGTWGIYKQGIGNNKAETFLAEPEGAGLGTAPLSPDGAFVLYTETPRTASAPTRLMRIPLNGGMPQPILETKGSYGFDCARAPASLCVLTEESQDEKQLTLTAFDPAKGGGKIIRTVQKDPSAQLGSTALSPDGTTLAFSTREAPTKSLLYVMMQSSIYNRQSSIW